MLLLQFRGMASMNLGEMKSFILAHRHTTLGCSNCGGIHDMNAHFARAVSAVEFMFRNEGVTASSGGERIGGADG
jgi:hypothetical protein